MNDIEYKYFLEVSKTLNISQAAKNLFISQPALSHCISKLEKEFNTKLLNRNKSKITLTNAGITILNEYPKVRLTLNQFKQSVYLSNKGRNCLVIGIQNGHIFDKKMKNIFTTFEEEYPNICINYINLQYKNIFNDLDEGNIDIALSFDLGQNNANKYNKIVLSKKENYIIVSKNNPVLNLQNYEDKIQYLNQSTLLSVDSSTVPMINNIIIKCCNKNNICPKDINYINNHSTLITNLIMNKGFTIFYKSELINDNLIEYIPLQNKHSLNLCIFYKKDINLTNNVKLFIDYIKKLKQ